MAGNTTPNQPNGGFGISFPSKEGLHPRTPTAPSGISGSYKPEITGYEFTKITPSPTFNRERILAGQVTERQTFGFMRRSGRTVLGSLFDADLFDRSMRPPRELHSGESETPMLSPYTQGLLNIAHTLARQQTFEAFDTQLVYIAVRSALNAQRLHRVQEAEVLMETGKVIFEPSQVRAWEIADQDGKKNIEKTVINQTANAGGFAELAAAMDDRLTVFAQQHEIEDQVSFLNDLSLIPFLEPDQQIDALQSFYPRLPVLATVPFFIEQDDATHSETGRDRAGISEPYIRGGKKPARERSRTGQTVDLRVGRPNPEILTDIPLSDEKFGSVLAFALNNLGKLLVLLAMQYGKAYGRAVFSREIDKLQYAARGWPEMNTGNNAAHYAQRSFDLAGLIDFVIDEGHNRVMLNDEGWRMRGVAGHLAQLSEEYPGISLQDVLGDPTGINEAKEDPDSDGEIMMRIRTAFTRLNIFETVLADEVTLPISQHDLHEILGPEFERKMVGSSLTELHRSGILQYNTPEANARYAVFEPVEDRPQEYPKIPGVKEPVRVVLDWLPTVSGQFTLDDFSNVPANAQMMATFSESNTIALFSRLVNLGYLRRAGRGYDFRSHSEINVTSDQRQFLTKFVHILQEAQNGNARFVREGLAIADDIITSPERERYTSLMNKAHHDSRGANRQNREDTKEQIVEVVTDVPDRKSIDAGKVQTVLSFIYKRRLSGNYVNTLLNELIREGRVTRMQKGTQFLYSSDTNSD